MLRPWKGFFPRIGPDCYIDAAAVLIGDVEIAGRSSVWPCAVLRGDEAAIRVGSGTSIQDNCVLHAATTVGNDVTVGHGAIVHGCIVEDGCLIGMGAIIMNDAVIGHHSLVGAGALVTGGVVIPPNSLVLGSPAKVVRPLRDSELADMKRQSDVYLTLTQEYLAGEE
ncbi:MAG: gamma carbonic anhydrase family protein [Oscillospiraceae bacterium]|nr:gamma carbonic anhydrase family protein [Oscillospiraceae bacterium]